MAAIGAIGSEEHNNSRKASFWEVQNIKKDFEGQAAGAYMAHNDIGNYLNGSKPYS